MSNEEKQESLPLQDGWLHCPVCGQKLSAEDRVLRYRGGVAACPACMARQGYTFSRLGCEEVQSNDTH